MHRKIPGLLLALVLISCFVFLVYADSTGKILPSGDGTATSVEWSKSDVTKAYYEHVDEDPPDNDTTFLTTPDTEVTAHENQFTKLAIGLPADATIDSVVIHAFCRRDYTINPTVPILNVGMMIGSTDYYSSNINVNDAETYTDYSNTWTISPATGSAWTETEIDNMQFLLKGQSQRTRVGGVYYYTTIMCTQYYMIVNYTPVSAEEWHEITSWTFSLKTRSWTQIKQWNWTLNAREWNAIQSWTFDLVTKQWNTIEEWTLTLITKKWNELKTWTFILRAPGWNEITQWAFTLTSLGWHDIRTWLFTLTTFNILYLIPILFFLVLLGSIFVLGWKFKKDN